MHSNVFGITNYLAIKMSTLEISVAELLKQFSYEGLRKDKETTSLFTVGGDCLDCFPR